MTVEDPNSLSTIVSEIRELETILNQTTDTIKRRDIQSRLAGLYANKLKTQFSFREMLNKATRAKTIFNKTHRQRRDID